MRRITASFGWLVLLLAGWLLLLLLLLLMLMLHSANACTFKYDQWVYSNMKSVLRVRVIFCVVVPDTDTG